MNAPRRALLRWSVLSLWIGLLVAQAANVKVTKDPQVLGRELFSSCPPVAYDGSLLAADDAAGIFSGGGDLPPGFKAGIVLSTGDAAFAKKWAHPPGIRAINEPKSDSELSELIGGQPAYDAARLSYQFAVPADKTNLLIRVALVSEENAARTSKGYNDVFALYLDGKEVAQLRASEAEAPQSGPKGKSTISRKGLRTVVLIHPIQLGPNTTHTLKFAIADGGDAGGDSIALINIDAIKAEKTWFKRRSDIPLIIQTQPPQTPVKVPDGGSSMLLISLALVPMTLLQKRLANARR